MVQLRVLVGLGGDRVGGVTDGLLLLTDGLEPLTEYHE